MSKLLKLIHSRLNDGSDATSSLVDLEQNLATLVERDSLSVSINSALNLRKQGRIDQSIALITKVNRAQLDAIIFIQKTVDKLLSRQHSGVVFAKFRQIFPFEMGIEDGDDAVRLVAFFHTTSNHSGEILCKTLNVLETDIAVETERLEFYQRRFQDGTEDVTIKKAQKAIEIHTNELTVVRLQILESVISTVDEYLVSIGADDTPLKARFDLSKWLYSLVTSTTKTIHAQDVVLDE